MSRPLPLWMLAPLVLLAPFALPDQLPGTAGEPDPAITVTADEIDTHVEVLASDLFEGREAGSLGERRAAKYIVSQLSEAERLQPGGEDGGWFQSFEVTASHEERTARNIIAVLPGTDEQLADEVIVCGAHYDHVGHGASGNSLAIGSHEIHNGADDNASGSATLLDLATSLANSDWQPRRTIMFQWYSGEELGLVGSRYWVKHPTLPLEDVVFMLNMDMVGRLTGRTLLVGGTGTSPGLSEMASGFCSELGLRMIDDPPGSAPSDNTPFYEAHIPVMFLFTGIHEDYHRPGDDHYKVNTRGAADIGRLAQRVVQTLDARDERPAFHTAPGDANLFRPSLYIGAVFDEAPDGRPRAAVVVPDTPSAEAGLHEGDVVLSVDGVDVASPAELDGLLKVISDDLPARSFVIQRDGEQRTLSIQPVVR